jgi:hypothetical protein
VPFGHGNAPRWRQTVRIMLLLRPVCQSDHPLPVTLYFAYLTSERARDLWADTTTWHAFDA